MEFNLFGIKRYIIDTKCNSLLGGNFGEDSIKNVVKQRYSMVIGSSYIKDATMIHCHSL